MEFRRYCCEIIKELKGSELEFCKQWKTLQKQKQAHPNISLLPQDVPFIFIAVIHVLGNQSAFPYCLFCEPLKFTSQLIISSSYNRSHPKMSYLLSLMLRIRATSPSFQYLWNRIISTLPMSHGCSENQFS